MIKFFRKIRKNLIIERKLSNYLIYAIGEIILVVIGILIALAINNKNQIQIIKEKEQIYLKGLRDEFLISKIKLNELINVNKNNLNGAKQLLDYISNNENLTNEIELSKLLYNTFSFDISFNPNNSLLNEMINSGSLKDISNTNLRIQLTNWVSTLDDIAKQENDLAIQRETVLNIFRKNDYSLRTIFEQTGIFQEYGLKKSVNNLSNLKLLSSTEFENNVLMFILSCYSTENSHYLPLMDDLNTILELINNELER